MTVGDRIRIRRKELGLSADELAAKLGKNRATIYRYESNAIENLPVGILEPLAKVLKTTPAFLMGWDTETQEQIDWMLSDEGQAASDLALETHERFGMAVPEFLSHLQPDDYYCGMTSCFTNEYPNRLLVLHPANNPDVEMFTDLALDCIDRLPESSSDLCVFTMLTCLYSNTHSFGVKNMSNFPLKYKKDPQGNPLVNTVEEFLKDVMKIANTNPDDLQKLLPIIKQFVQKDS